MDLKNHVVLLSGATGALGAAFATFVLKNGGKVAAAVRKSRQVASVTALLGSERVLAGCVGPGDSEAAAGFVKGAQDALGPITALVCASGHWSGAPVGKEPAGELLDLLEANLLFGANLARAVIGGMRRRRSGSLVFVGSAAVGADGAGANYLASKAAVHEYVRALARELDGSGVRAAAILPTTIDTEQSRKLMPEADRSQWLSLDRVVEVLAQHAFSGTTGAGCDGGPLYPLRK